MRPSPRGEGRGGVDLWIHPEKRGGDRDAGGARRESGTRKSDSGGLHLGGFAPKRKLHPGREPQKGTRPVKGPEARPAPQTRALRPGPQESGCWVFERQEPGVGPAALRPGRSPGSPRPPRLALCGTGDRVTEARGREGDCLPGPRRRWQVAEQGQLQRATRIISTGPGAGPGTGDTWGYARDRPRPRARLPQGSARSALAATGGWAGPASRSLFSPPLSLSGPPPHPVLTPTPPLAGTPSRGR